MHQVEMRDGRTVGEFLHAANQELVNAKLKLLHGEAISDPDVKSVRQMSRIGRNESCPCGSGIKFKKCCINRSKEVI